jgi:hypothetical protein
VLWPVATALGRVRAWLLLGSPGFNRLAPGKGHVLSRRAFGYVFAVTGALGLVAAVTAIIGPGGALDAPTAILAAASALGLTAGFVIARRAA